MPNTNKIQELVRAFNIVLCHDDVAITNFIVEVKNTKRPILPDRKEEHIVISFDKNMDQRQCAEHLSNMKESIVKKFCGNEDAASKLFYAEFFPLSFDQGKWIKDSSSYKFSVLMNREVISNLKFFLANSLAGVIVGDIMVEGFGQRRVNEGISDESFSKKSYLYCMCFSDQELQDSFVKSFLLMMEDYKNGPKDFLEIKKDRVYIKKGIFDNIEFIKDIVKCIASMECRYFEAPNTEDEALEDQKFLLVDLFRKAGMSVDYIWRDSYLGSGENSILVPLINNNNYWRLLRKEEVDHINSIFGMAVLNNVEGHTSQESLPLLGSKGVYGIDFSNPDISYCVVNKIIEISIINKDHELSIDPERVPVMQLPTETQTPKIENDPLSNHGSSYYGPSGSFDVDSHGDLSDQEEVLSSGSSSNQTPCSSLNSPNSQATFIPLLR